MSDLLGYLRYTRRLVTEANRVTTAYVPVLNTARDKHKLRTANTYVLNLARVSQDVLVFRDEINLGQLLCESRLRLTLIDHNTLIAADARLEPAVCGVIDHHINERGGVVNERVLVEIDPVGSCSTLIAEKLIRNNTFTVDSTLALLLYATIAVDTINFSPQVGRTTRRDIDVARSLGELLRDMDTEQLYRDIQEAKFDLTGLSNMDLLEMDAKILEGPDIKMAISSVTMHVEDLVSRAGFVDDIQLFSDIKNVSAVIIMTLSSPLSATPQRQIAVFSRNSVIRKQITEILETVKNPSLELSPLEFFSDTINIYDQGNVHASRKKVLPIVKAYLRDRTNLQTAKKSTSFDHGVSISFDESNNSEIGVISTSDIASIGDVDFGDFPQPSMEFSADPTEEFSSRVLNNIMFYDSDLLGACSSRTPESGCSNPDTPPNSRNSQDDSHSLDHRDLPSFNNAEMVGRIIEKKASLEQQCDTLEPCSNYPFTPPNSFVNSELNRHESQLPSFLNSEMVLKMQDKKEDMGVSAAEFDIDGKYPFTPHNSFIDVKLKDGSLREDTGNMVDLLPANMEDQVFLKQNMLEALDEMEALDVNFLNDEVPPRVAPFRSKSPFLDSIQDHNFREILEHGPEFCKSLSDDEMLSNWESKGGRITRSECTTSAGEGTLPHPDRDPNGSLHFDAMEDINDLRREEKKEISECVESSDNVVAEKICEALKREVNGYLDENGSLIENGSDDISPEIVSNAMNNNVSVRIPSNRDRNEAINIVAGFIASEIISSAIQRVSDEQRDDLFPDVENLIAKNIAQDMITERGSNADIPTLNVCSDRDSPDRDSDGYLSVSDDEISDNESNMVAGLIAAEIRSNRFSVGDITMNNNGRVFPPCGTTQWSDQQEDIADDDIDETPEKSPVSDKNDIDKVALDLAQQIVSDAKKKYVDMYGHSNALDLKDNYDAHLKCLNNCDDIEQMSYLLTADIISNVVENFPVFQIYRDEILADSDISLEEVTYKNHSSPLMVETDYLPNVDQYKGDISYALTYQNSLKKYIRNMSITNLNQDISSLTDDIEQDNVNHRHETEDTDKTNLTNVDEMNENIELENLRKSVYENDATVISPISTEIIRDLPSPQTNYGKKLINSQSVDAKANESSKRAVYMTSAGRMSVSMDSAVTQVTTPTQDARFDSDHRQVGDIKMRTESLLSDVDAMLACAAFIITQKQEGNNQEWWDPTESELKLTDEHVPRGHKRGISSSSIEAVEKMRDLMFTKEYPDEEEATLDEKDDTRAEAVRPQAFPVSTMRQKHKLIPMISVTVDDDLNGVTPSTPSDLDLADMLQTPDDILTPDGVETPEDGHVVDDAEWETMALLGSKLQAAAEDPDRRTIPEYSASEERSDTKHWRSVTIGDEPHTIDMQAIYPYKKVLLHGGYIMDGMNAIILFCGCFLPDKGHKEYQYIMNNLFLYILHTLDCLIVQDYTIVYFHGATPRRQTPSFSWLRRCYQMIDRRLKKTLCGLLLVHPTLWLKTVVLMSRPFISSKFSSQIKFVKTLADLESLIPMENVFIPDPIKLYDERCSSLPRAPSPPTSPTHSPPSHTGQPQASS